MFKSRIQLDTMKEVNDFVTRVSCVKSPVYLVDGAGLKVSAKSILGAVYTLEWDKLYVESDVDLGSLISDYRVFEE